jgi:CBS-domain-containing membrane protein
LYLSLASAMKQLCGVKVDEIMSRPVVTVAADAGIKAAATLLAEHSVSALPVVNARGELVGIVSEADLMSIETRPDPRTQATPLPPTAGSSPKTVAEVMTREVLTVSTGSEVSQAARIMLDAGIKRVPVVQGRQVVGILSRRDLIKVIARRDADIEGEIELRLRELGLDDIGSGNVSVAAGVATIRVDGPEASSRRLAESVALTVPGVLEVRFATGETPRER